MSITVKVYYNGYPPMSTWGTWQSEYFTDKHEDGTTFSNTRYFEYWNGGIRV